MPCSFGFVPAYARVRSPATTDLPGRDPGRSVVPQQLMIMISSPRLSQRLEVPKRSCPASWRLPRTSFRISRPSLPAEVPEQLADNHIRSHRAQGKGHLKVRVTASMWKPFSERNVPLVALAKPCGCVVPDEQAAGRALVLACDMRDAQCWALHMHQQWPMFRDTCSSVRRGAGSRRLGKRLGRAPRRRQQGTVGTSPLLSNRGADAASPQSVCTVTCTVAPRSGGSHGRAG
jgi:hypothetical protein